MTKPETSTRVDTRRTPRTDPPVAGRLAYVSDTLINVATALGNIEQTMLTAAGYDLPEIERERLRRWAGEAELLRDHARTIREDVQGLVGRLRK